jgi:hypothetical protein
LDGTYEGAAPGILSVDDAALSLLKTFDDGANSFSVDPTTIKSDLRLEGPWVTPCRTIVMLLK